MLSEQKRPHESNWTTHLTVSCSLQTNGRSWQAHEGAACKQKEAIGTDCVGTTQPAAQTEVTTRGDIDSRATAPCLNVAASGSWAA